MPLTTQHTWMLSCWLEFGWHVTLSERSEATLLPLSWILVTLCVAQKSCLPSLETQPGPSKANEMEQNGLQSSVVPICGRVHSDASYKTWK